MTYTLYLRDSSLQRVAEIDDFADFEAVCRFNATGTWTLALDRRQRNASDLTEPGWGVVLYRDSMVVVSGPATQFKHSVGNRQQLVVSGVDDNVWFSRRVVSPVPSASSPPYSTQEYDVRTNTASTALRQYADVNLGPSAVSARRLAALALGTDPLAGSTVIGRGRWQELLTLEQELATAGGVGFRIRQAGTVLEFQAYATTDRTGTVKFGMNLGNLAGYDYELTAPTANYIYVLGGGEGTARVVRERADWSSIATWGRIEKTIDRRDTTDTTELDQTGDEALVEHGQRTNLSITPIDSPQLLFGNDYDLGDRVSVALDSGEIQDLIQQVTIKLDPDGQRETPGVGTDHADVLGIFRTFRAMARRLNDLERRR